MPFDPRLEAAATQLIANGGVTDVRILQGGGVVTGVVGKHRVYIRRLAGGGKLEGECNCNERSPCVHVAAVAIAAEKSPASQPSSLQRSPVGSPGSPVQQQRLLYLLKPKLPLGVQVDVFVGQPSGAQPFAFRSSLGGEGFPRYVEATDKLILKELATGEPSNTLLQQVAATGRSFWSSLRTPALRIGPTRSAPFAWQ